MRTGVANRRWLLRYRHSCILSWVQTVSLGVRPSPGRSIPATYLMPLRKRRKFRSRSRWTRRASSVGSYVSRVALELSGIPHLLQGLVDRVQLSLEHVDLSPQASHVVGRGDVPEVHQPLAERLDHLVPATIEPGEPRRLIGEGVRPHHLLETGSDLVVPGVEHSSPARSVLHAYPLCA